MFSINLGAPRAGIDETAVRARIKIAGLKMGFTCGALLMASGGSMSGARRAGGNDAFPTILSLQPSTGAATVKQDHRIVTALLHD
jgi:hypothetical protein